MLGQLGDKLVLMGQKWRMRSLGEFVQGGVSAACSQRPAMGVMASRTP
jgi:hypothetical protein